MLATSSLAAVDPAPPTRTWRLLPEAAQAARGVKGLGDAIAELAARLHAATYELLVLLRAFDEANGWNNGFLSCAHWLHWRTGIDLGAAREKVRVARALASLPRLGGAMQRGEVSYAKVRALTRIATPENEAQLLDLALAGTAAHVERLVRAWRRVDSVQAAKETERRHLRRELTTWVDEEGMVVIRGRLTPEIGAVVQRALEAASDRLFRESAETPRPGTLTEEVTAAQRRADALGLLAETAFSANLDAGTAGDRYQVVLHVDAADNTEATKGADVSRVERNTASIGQAVLEVGDGGVYVSAETSERITCDASVVVMRHGPDGSVLDVGRKTRTIPPAIRRALAARDTRCQFPGCTARRCDAHHITHWADGGPTRLDNLVLLCRRHHRAMHEGGFGVTRELGGGLAFVSPDGRPLQPVPSPVRLAGPCNNPLAPVVERLAEAGVTIDATTSPSWDGTPFDVVWAIDVLRGRKTLRMGPPVGLSVDPGCGDVSAETYCAPQVH